jgi:formylglycine-generating enzyme required for sulfatase activity
MTTADKASWRPRVVGQQPDLALRPASGPDLVLVHIPAGDMVMGDQESDKRGIAHSSPQHRLYLDSYYIGAHPVTMEQFSAFVQATGYSRYLADKAARGSHPAQHIDWYGAQTFCAWLTEASGQAVRLPTEAEWEKAARGADGRRYPWGDAPPDASRCNYGNPRARTTVVGRYSPAGDSPYGCADMAGNVWEWTASLWGRDWRAAEYGYPYSATDGRESLEAGVAWRRVVRGGSFADDEAIIRCAYRLGFSPYTHNIAIGFRVAVSLR